MAKLKLTTVERELYIQYVTLMEGHKIPVRSEEEWLRLYRQTQNRVKKEEPSASYKN